jgi:hypothetical protein
MISGFWDGLDWLCLDGKLQWATVSWVVSPIDEKVK